MSFLVLASLLLGQVSVAVAHPAHSNTEVQDYGNLETHLRSWSSSNANPHNSVRERPWLTLPDGRDV